MTAQDYKTFSYRFDSKGLIARAPADNLPPGFYANVENLESRIEGAFSSRYGRVAITASPGTKVNTPLPAAVHSLSRLKSLNNLDGTANTYRYAGAGSSLYRRQGDAPGAYSLILTGLSGKRFSTIDYRPSFSSYPYLFLADALKMVKDNGSGVTRWGIFRPATPVKASLESPTFIANFEASEGWVSDGIPISVDSLIATTLTNSVSGPGVATITPASMANIRKNALLTIDTGANAEVVRVNTIADYSFGTVCLKAHTAGIPISSNVEAGSFPSASTSNFYEVKSIDLSVQGTAALVNTGAADIIRLGMLLNGNVGTYNPVYPTTLMNGWSSHEGAYEEGQSQHFGWGTGSADAYSSPELAYDGNDATYAGSSIHHSHGYAGCIWSFSYTGNSPKNLILRILSEVPTSGGARSAGIWYSLDAGLTWKQIYNDASRAKQWDTIVLPTDQDLNQVQVMAFLDAHDNMDHRVYEIEASAAVDNVRLAFDVGDGSFVDYYESIASVPSLGTYQDVDFLRSSFVNHGAAGSQGHNWANVVRVRITVTSGGEMNVGFDDLYLSPAGGPDVTGGSAYDYRVTLFDIDTGDESPPTPIVIEVDRQWPENQPMQVTWDAFDANFYGAFTHYRVYRRGGSLPTGWILISEVPFGTNSLLDTLSDEAIASKSMLEIDNYPPLTSTLRVPVDTVTSQAIGVGTQTIAVASTDKITTHQELTIDAMLTEETVVVQAVDSVNKTITAYFQLPHLAGARVYGQATYGKPCSFVSLAFERAWFSGDPENPGRLYYSKKGRVASCPPQNYIDLSSPGDPIIGHLETGGYLWVSTMSTWYRVFSPSGGAAYVQNAGVSQTVSGTAPQSIKTGSRHGMVSPFLFAKVANDVVYEAFDGIYSLQGEEVSKMLQWLFRDEADGPLSPMDRTQVDSQVFGFEKNEVFISYLNKLTQRKRIIFSQRDMRWRNDDVAATAMLYEEDTGNLVIGRADGMIFQDRVGDVDNEGYAAGAAISAPIALNLQTTAMDLGKPKNDKNWNEFTLDANTHGEAVNISLLFDNATTPLSLGTVQTSRREQVQLKVNNGEGYLSRNVSINVTGAAGARVDLFELHIRALIEAEARKSYDSYWQDDGTAEWKLYKQGYFTYRSSRPVTGVIYFDGVMNPAFSFSLPASANRHVALVRLGAPPARPAFKAKLRRVVLTSTEDFYLFPDSHLEAKPVISGKGYGKIPLNL